MKDDVKLGQLLDATAQRDAIHIAIAPVTASQTLSPGESCGMLPDGTLGNGSTVKKIGIIDPFLTDDVTKGERCYLFLYPNTVTGMRHHWEHPAFIGDGKPANDKSESHHKSEQWLRAFIEKRHCQGYELYTTYDDLINGADCFTASGEDLHSSHDLEAGEEQEFWHHMEIVTGKTFDKKHRENFTWSCSC